jgi:hypothetical protein
MTGESIAEGSRRLDLERELRVLDRGERVGSLEPLSGGMQANVWRITYDDGTIVVAKMLDDAPEDTFRLEAEGLTAWDAQTRSLSRGDARR